MCQKKVTSYPGEVIVKCSSATCNRKMKLSRCKDMFTVELTPEGLDLKQTIVTVFPRTILKIFPEATTEERIEDLFLSIEKHDFIINKKKIVENIIPHKSS